MSEANLAWSGPRPAIRDIAASTEPEPRAATALQIDVYADGADLQEMLQAYQAGIVRGFTTNPTLMRQAGVTNYGHLAKSVLAGIRDLPIPFEVLADEL